MALIITLIVALTAGLYYISYYISTNLDTTTTIGSTSMCTACTTPMEWTYGSSEKDGIAVFQTLYDRMDHFLHVTYGPHFLIVEMQESSCGIEHVPWAYLTGDTITDTCIPLTPAAEYNGVFKGNFSTPMDGIYQIEYRWVDCDGNCRQHITGKLQCLRQICKHQK